MMEAVSPRAGRKKWRTYRCEHGSVLVSMGEIFFLSRFVPLKGTVLEQESLPFLDALLLSHHPNRLVEIRRPVLGVRLGRQIVGPAHMRHKPPNCVPNRL